MGIRKTESRNFARDVVVVTGVVSVLVMGAVAYLAAQVQRDISEQYIHDSTDRAAKEFRSMQGSVEDLLVMVRDWGASGLVSLSSPEKLRKLLYPIFGKERLLSGISVADAEGSSYFIQSDGSERKPTDTDGFDPRSRPWYDPALETPGVYWTKQYLFHTLQQVGITASVSFVPPQKKGKRVVAFDVLLTDLYLKIKEMSPSENSDFIIFRRDALLFLPESTAGSSAFVPFASVTNAVVNSAHAFWAQGRGSDEEVFSFMHRGKLWWCGFRPLENARQDIWMGVIVPESDIVGDVGRRRAVLLFFGLALILVVAGSAAWLTRRYGRAFGEAQSAGIDNTEEGVRALVGHGEDRSVEFKSTMRMNLHSKKPGKEIELAWLKGVAAFLNTDGGTLLFGVTDAGEITGIEQDVFENEDKCRLHFKNLIATHIGAELSKYIRFVLVSMDSKTVGVVHCSRSSEPVFLKDVNKEHFYIRNGPSSDELPVSKALKYIKNRK
jgi:hypothetical protein